MVLIQVRGIETTEGRGGEWLVCPTVRAALADLDVVLKRAIVATDAQLREMVLQLIRRGGKRLRPALLLVAAELGSHEDPRLLQAAAAVELLHNATLYHDDVMDRAPSRRGAASVNVLWGNELATLAGTYLFGRACALLSELGDVPNQCFSQASVDLCTGQLLEMENAFNLSLTEDEHLGILIRKTATLFVLPCRLGSYLGGLSPIDDAALVDYGRHLGLAFQLADDALDLAGEASQMGKATGTDLREGVYSLPVLRVLCQETPAGKELNALLRQACLSSEDMQRALDLIRRSEAVAETLTLARAHAEQAQESLDGLPHGSARQSLMRLAEFAITRAE